MAGLVGPDHEMCWFHLKPAQVPPNRGDIYWPPPPNPLHWMEGWCFAGSCTSERQQSRGNIVLVSIETCTSCPGWANLAQIGFTIVTSILFRILSNHRICAGFNRNLHILSLKLSALSCAGFHGNSPNPPGPPSPHSPHNLALTGNNTRVVCFLFMGSHTPLTFGTGATIATTATPTYWISCIL